MLLVPFTILIKLTLWLRIVQDPTQVVRKCTLDEGIPSYRELLLVLVFDF